MHAAIRTGKAIGERLAGVPFSLAVQAECGGKQIQAQRVFREHAQHARKGFACNADGQTLVRAEAQAEIALCIGRATQSDGLLAGRERNRADLQQAVGFVYAGIAAFV